MNHLYLFIVLPFYFSFFLNNINLIFKVITPVVILNLITSIIQQVNMIIDPFWVNIFNNYPQQEFYSYPITFFGIFRVSGLFNESSQYSTFLVIFLLLHHMKLIVNDRITRVTSFLALIDLILNFSITAYLILIIYLISLIIKSKEVGKVSKGLLISIAFSILTPLIYEKVLNTLSLSDDSYPRLIQTISSVIQTYENHFFFGNGLSWENPSWDLFSIYFSGYGFIGFMAIFYFISKLYSRQSFTIYMSFIIFLLTNGNLLLSLNIFIMSLIFSMNFKPFNRPEIVQ